MRTRSRERAEFGNSSERKSQKISLLHSTAFWRRHILLEADFLKKAVDYSDWFSPPCVQKDGRVRFKSSSIGWIYMLRGGETRCSAVWSAHLFWVQRAIGSNPVTLTKEGLFFFLYRSDTLSREKKLGITILILGNRKAVVLLLHFQATL
ncbi:hypothetical protein OIU78_014742 [Salix suchowensis]|jgi:hypothetical protein|nr:hypothetical protein OIU78_014742 [Salix suchowensis]